MSEVTLPVKRVTGDTVRERLTENAVRRILPSRYLRRNEDGELAETPAEMFERVATAVARAEGRYGGDPGAWATTFEEMMTGLEFVPNSPTLMNAGTNREQLSACFVLSPGDDLTDIFDTVTNAAKIFNSGGGVGYSFSALRPEGDPVRTETGAAAGPVSFMHVFDEMCAQLKQGGKRRGAQMGILRADHPDVGRFCTAKREEGVLSNFNVSVGVTEAFDRAVRDGERYELVNPRTGEQHEVTAATASFYSTEYESAPDHAVATNFWRDYADDVAGIGQYRGETDLEAGEPMTLPAGFVWRLIVDGAWRNGEPGLFAIDEANRQHTFDVESHPEHRIRATNPCGEQPLEEAEACTLGHVNLSLMAADGRTPWPAFDGDVDAFLDQAIDWDRLDRVARDGTRFLDDVNTVCEFPVAEIGATVEELRKVGLGVMGFAELLLQLGVRYGSGTSLAVADRVMGRIQRVSTGASRDLAEERGTFPAWDESKLAAPTAHADWFGRHTGRDAGNWTDGFPTRNHSTTTIAPTGTTSMIANTSGGCEPLFSVAYRKNVSPDVEGGEAIVEFDDYFLRVLEANAIDVDEVKEAARQQIADGEFEGASGLPIPDAIADPFVTARDVAPEDHVRVQAAFQEHVDAGISKTVNVPNDATREDVADAFRLALDAGCKGLTIYRNRSRSEQVLQTSAESLSEDGKPDEARCCPL
ncbi:MAG: adenosylcobalamin-dependent ribonucleoside-diphosphate reductase [Halobacteriaceae archaeon]